MFRHLFNHHKHFGWSELVATNAPIEDDAVEAVLGMNQKRILLARNY
jgi:hypothetical protein